MSIVKEFREFAIKGNFIDLAVGVIIGAASGKVVTGLVEKVIMPPIGLLTGKVNFSDLRFILQPSAPAVNGGEPVKEVSIGYGMALQSLIELLIIAFVVFLIVRVYNRFRKQSPPDPSGQEKLLAEIRDLLKAQQAKAPAKD
jgi:large conductance mechanosensitive channel